MRPSYLVHYQQDPIWMVRLVGMTLHLHRCEILSPDYPSTPEHLGWGYLLIREEDGQLPNFQLLFWDGRVQLRYGVIEPFIHPGSRKLEEGQHLPEGDIYEALVLLREILRAYTFTYTPPTRARSATRLPVTSSSRFTSAPVSL